MAKAKAKSSSAPKNIDWAKARNDYIFDATITYPDIARKYGVSLTMVKKKGVADGWPEVRQTFAEKAYNDFSAKMLEEKNKIQSEQLENYKAMTELVMQTTRSMIDKGQQLNDKSGNPIIDPDTDMPLYGQVDAFQLEKLARALDIAEKGRRLVLGLPTSVSGLSNPDGSNIQGLSELAARADEVPDDGPGN